MLPLNSLIRLSHGVIALITAAYGKIRGVGKGQKEKEPELIDETSFTNESEQEEKIDREGKYAKNMIDPEEVERYLEMLDQYMRTNKPYLNPNISVNQLAKLVSIPTHHLSQLINGSLNKNFYDYMNSYRIQESQRLMIEGLNHKKTMLEVLLESGFNTKSTFNRAFKKQTGKTPSAFLKQLKESKRIE